MIRTLVDKAGANTSVALTSDRSLVARGWVMFTSLVGASRVGGSDTDSTHGAAVPAGATVVFPAPHNYGGDAYTLADLKAYIPTGTTLSITYQE